MPCRATQRDITRSPLISVIPGSSGIRPAPRRFRDGLDARRTSGHLPPGGTPLIPYNVPGCGRRQRELRFRRHVALGWKALASQRVWQTLLTTSRTRVSPAARSGLDLYQAKSAKCVVQQGLSRPTQHNSELNITAGATVPGRIYSPLVCRALARRTRSDPPILTLPPIIRA